LLIFIVKFFLFPARNYNENIMKIFLIPRVSEYHKYLLLSEKDRAFEIEPVKKDRLVFRSHSVENDSI